MIEHTGPVSGIAAHPRGYVATAGYDNQVVLWDRADRRPLARAFHDHLANQCAFNARGDLLVTASSDYTARVWSVPDLRLLAVLGGHDDDVEMAAFHPSEPLVATASRDHRVRIFDLDGRLLHTFAGHTADVLSVVWTAGGDEVISSSDDGTVKRWSPSAGGLTGDLDLGGVETDTIAVGPWGVVYAGNDEGRIVMLREDGGPPQSGQAHDAGIKRLILDPVTRLLVSLSYDRTMGLWCVHDDGLEPVLRAALPPDVWPRSAAFASESTLVFATFGSSYRTYDIRRGRWRDERVGPTSGINAVCARPGGPPLTVGDAGTVATTRGAVARPGSLCNFLTPVDDDLVVTGGQLGQVFNALTGEVLHQHRSPLNCAAAFGDLAVVGTYTGEGVVLRSLGGGTVEHVADVALHANAVKGLAVSGDLLFSVCADRSAAWHRLPGMEPVARRGDAHDKIANGCAALGGGSFASVSRDLRLRLWDADRAVTAIRTPHTHSIKCVAASSDGRLIATGSYDGTVAVYDRVRRLWSPVLRPTASGISCLTFDAERRMFLASSYDGRVHEVAAGAELERAA